MEALLPSSASMARTRTTSVPAGNSSLTPTTVSSGSMITGVLSLTSVTITRTTVLALRAGLPWSLTSMWNSCTAFASRSRGTLVSISPTMYQRGGKITKRKHKNNDQLVAHIFQYRDENSTLVPSRPKKLLIQSTSPTVRLITVDFKQEKKHQIAARSNKARHKLFIFMRHQPGRRKR